MCPSHIGVSLSVPPTSTLRKPMEESASGGGGTAMWTGSEERRGSFLAGVLGARCVCFCACALVHAAQPPGGRCEHMALSTQSGTDSAGR